MQHYLLNWRNKPQCYRQASTQSLDFNLNCPLSLQLENLKYQDTLQTCAIWHKALLSHAQVKVQTCHKIVTQKHMAPAETPGELSSILLSL